MNGISSAKSEGNPIHLALSEGRKDLWVRQAVWCFCTLLLCFPIHTQRGRHTSSFIQVGRPEEECFWAAIALGGKNGSSSGLVQGLQGRGRLSLIQSIWPVKLPAESLGPCVLPGHFKTPFIIFLTQEMFYLWLASPTRSAVETAPYLPCSRASILSAPASPPGRLWYSKHVWIELTAVFEGNHKLGAKGICYLYLEGTRFAQESRQSPRHLFCVICL